MPDLLRRGLRLEYATLAWNVTEIGFIGTAAVLARSVALAGFALDSLIEIFASLVVVEQLRGTATPEGDARAIRRIGLAFLALAAYLVVQSVVTLVAGIRPDPSPLGIAWLALTAGAMTGLAMAKGDTGRRSGNPVLLTESRVTYVDGALATSVLIGLLLNATLGWWWADLVGGAVVIAYGLREGVAALREPPSHPVSSAR